MSNGALRGYSDIPDYSTSIEAAWEVFLRLEGCWRLVKSDSWPGYETGPVYHCRNVGDEFYDSRDPEHVWVDGLLAPLVICRAALLAVAGREG